MLQKAARMKEQFWIDEEGDVRFSCWLAIWLITALIRLRE